MHTGLLAQLRLHLLYAKPWQRALVAGALLAVGLVAGLLLLVVLGAVLLLTTGWGWWRADRTRRRQRWRQR
jgi:hypothetical protein